MIDKIEELFAIEQDGKIYNKVIEYAQGLLIRKALERTFGNQIIAAKILGINRNTLRSKIKKLNINTGQFKI